MAAPQAIRQDADMAYCAAMGRPAEVYRAVFNH
jgi:hypothetical protein